MDATLEKLFDSLSDPKRTISQITGLSRKGKTTLLLMVADFYISLGKQVLYISYSDTPEVSYYAEKYQIPSIAGKNIVYHNNSNLETLIKTFESKKFNAEKIVILLDDLDAMSTPQFNGAPSRKKNYYSNLLNNLIKYSSHIIFTNRCHVSWQDLKNTILGTKDADTVTITTTIRIPVHYSIILDEKIVITDDVIALLTKAKRKQKIANLDF
jgi:Cdc6-like AAA superfamily ATPase